MKPELIIPERKGNHGPKPKRLTVTEESVKMSDYIKGLDRQEWEEIKVRKTAKGTLRGLYHFKKVYIWNKPENQIKQRLLVIRRMKTKPESGLRGTSRWH